MCGSNCYLWVVTKTFPITALQTNRQQIAELAEKREEENDRFRFFLKSLPSHQVDAMVHRLNDEISAANDCTQCGACCRKLMIEVSASDAERMATGLQIDITDFETSYVEKGHEGRMLLNHIPCRFLEGNKCTQYEHRFTDCREFPHLHQPNFTGRLFSTLMNYAICPIIFNVVEELKKETQFY